MDRRQRRSRLAHPEVHARRQVRGAVRQGRARARIRRRRPTSRSYRRTASTWTTSAASPRSSSIRRRTRATSSDGYFNHRVAVIDLDSGKIKRIWGAYGKPPTDEQPRPATIRPRRRRAAVPQPGALRRDVERRHGLRLRPPERSRPGVHEGRQVRARSTSSTTQTRCRTARCGTSPSRRTRSSSSSTWPTAPTSTCASSTASR